MPVDPWKHSVAKGAEDYPPIEKGADIPNSLQAILNRDLRILCVSALGWTCDPLWRIEDRVLADDLFSVVESGTGVFRYGKPNREERFGPGILMAIPEGCAHSIVPDAGQRLELTHFHFYARIAGSVDPLVRMDLAGTVRLSGGELELCREAARDYTAGAPLWMASAAATISRLVVRLIRERYDADSRPALPFALERLAPVFDLIDRRLSDPGLQVADLAAAAAMSEAGLRKVFARQVGTAPAEYLRRRRIDHACVLLRTTDARLDVIAEACGFADQSLLSRLFRRYRGTSPGSYRKMNPM